MSPERAAPHDFDMADVSRETLGQLEAFASALTKWSRSINLVAPSTLPQVWERHVLDSLQIARFLPEGESLWLDIGSGGGLPALPLAIVARELAPHLRFMLVESDKRKAAFLKSQIHAYRLRAEVRAERIESVAPSCAQRISARAFANLDATLEHVHRHLDPSGKAVLHKGRSFQEEIEIAQERWDFSFQVVRSKVEDDSVLLIVESLERRTQRA